MRAILKVVVFEEQQDLSTSSSMYIKNMLEKIM